MLWGSGSVPGTCHSHLKQNYTVTHVSICSVNLLITKFAVSIPLDYVSIVAAVFIEAIKTGVPDCRVHALDVLLD